MWAIVTGIFSFLKSLPDLARFCLVLLQIFKPMWDAYQARLKDEKSKEAAAKLKEGVKEASATGDTSKIENWFSPGRNSQSTQEEGK